MLVLAHRIRDRPFRPPRSALVIPIRPAAVTAALALTGGLLLAPSATASPTASAADPAAPLTLRSANLTVTVAGDFPRVVRYVDNVSGQALSGQPDTISTVTINGKPQTTHLTAAPAIS